MTTPLPDTLDTPANWLLYLLADSALPTGGFVASSGLESAHQSGLLPTPASLSSFVAASSHAFAHSTVGLVKAGWGITIGEGVMDDHVGALRGVDDLCEAIMATNAVAKRASLAQGMAMLTLYTKCFMGTEGRTAQDALIKAWKSEIRAGRAHGHFSVCFGLVCNGLGVDECWCFTIFIKNG